MRNLFLEMPADVHQKLKDLAYVNGVTMKEFIIRFIESQPDPQIRRPESADEKRPN